jgi:hypothetical protein
VYEAVAVSVVSVEEVGIYSVEIELYEIDQEGLPLDTTRI